MLRRRVLVAAVSELSVLLCRVGDAVPDVLSPRQSPRRPWLRPTGALLPEQRTRLRLVCSQRCPTVSNGVQRVQRCPTVSNGVQTVTGRLWLAVASCAAILAVSVPSSCGWSLNITFIEVCCHGDRSSSGGGCEALATLRDATCGYSHLLLLLQVSPSHTGREDSSHLRLAPLAVSTALTQPFVSATCTPLM